MDSCGLKCIICPKTPTFSDVSHLLTHVSSKGHLAHQFKLSVRSPQEPEVKQLLAEYDQWYNEHELGKLLSERMFLKGSKRSGTRKSGTVFQRKLKPLNLSASDQLGPQQDPQDVLDPALSQGHNDGSKVRSI